MVLLNNGLVIQARIDSMYFVVPPEFRQTPEFLRYQSYRGIARYESWPLGGREDPVSKALTKEANDRWFYCYEGLKAQEYPLEVVPDLEYCTRYFRACGEKGIETRILFCKTERQTPVWETAVPDSVVLGYDYATSGEFFYSTIPDDLLVDDIGPLLEQSRAALNGNQLFNSEAHILRYIERRRVAIESGAPLESVGDFCIYHLSEVNPEFLQR